MFLKYCSGCFVTKEVFEDTNGVIKTRISIEEEQKIHKHVTSENIHLMQNIFQR
jgi:hypothetical protein